MERSNGVTQKLIVLLIFLLLYCLSKEIYQSSKNNVIRTSGMLLKANERKKAVTNSKPENQLLQMNKLNGTAYSTICNERQVIQNASKFKEDSKLLQENLNLKAEQSKLQGEHSKLVAEHSKLKEEYSKFRNLHVKLEIEHSSMQQNISHQNEQINTSQEPSSDNVVMSVSLGYGLEIFKAFILPLRNHYHGDVIILTTPDINSTIREFCHRHKVQLVPNMTVKHLGLFLAERFAWYKDVCQRYTGYCLAIDVRDVFFQANPFKNMRPDIDLVLSEESRSQTIKSEKWNNMWMSGCYGNNTLEQIGNNPIINAGIIFGRRFGFSKFTTLFNQHINRKLGPCDQSCLDYMYYTHKLSTLRILVQQQGDGIVNTVGIIPQSEISKHINHDGFVVNKDGSLATIVHQYDRFEVLVKKYRSEVRSLENRSSLQI